MKTENYQSFESWNSEELVIKSIIYLDAYRKPRRGNRVKSVAIFWNVLFTVMCLSVLACLFLH